jgi:hypothetical protein
MGAVGAKDATIRRSVRQKEQNGQNRDGPSIGPYPELPPVDEDELGAGSRRIRPRLESGRPFDAGGGLGASR